MVMKMEGFAIGERVSTPDGVGEVIAYCEVDGLPHVRVKYQVEKFDYARAEYTIMESESEWEFDEVSRVASHLCPNCGSDEFTEYQDRCAWQVFTTGAGVSPYWDLYESGDDVESTVWECRECGKSVEFSDDYKRCSLAEFSTDTTWTLFYIMGERDPAEDQSLMVWAPDIAKAVEYYCDYYDVRPAQAINHDIANVMRVPMKPPTTVSHVDWSGHRVDYSNVAISLDNYKREEK